MPQQLKDVREPVNALFYGEGGTGKTTDLAFMANLGKVLVINAESGVKAGPLEALGVEIENIEVFPGEGEELDYDSLEGEWLRIREELNEDPDAYAGVFFDSITEVQAALKDRTVIAAVDRANKAGRERSRWVVDQDNWREVNEQCRALIRRFRDLPIHFGMSALQRRESDDDGSVSYQPAVTPGLQSDLNLWVDVTCHTSTVVVDGETEYRGLFAPHSKWRGKDRTGKLPKWLVDPTFDRIVAYRDGELEAEDDPVMLEARERAKRAAQNGDEKDKAETGGTGRKEKE